jgi:hypothetical protein
MMEPWVPLIIIGALCFDVETVWAPTASLTEAPKSDCRRDQSQFARERSPVLP